MSGDTGQEFSQDWYFNPATATELGGAEEQLDAIKITGDFATDAKAFLLAIAQGSKALDSGDLVKARAELQALLDGSVTVNHLDINPQDMHLHDAEQAAMKRVLAEVLKGK